MRIIKHGDTYLANVYTCKSCGCTFEYTTNDVEKVDLGDQVRYKVSCPECGTVLQKSLKHLLFNNL